MLTSTYSNKWRWWLFQLQTKADGGSWIIYVHSITRYVYFIEIYRRKLARSLKGGTFGKNRVLKFCIFCIADILSFDHIPESIKMAMKSGIWWCKMLIICTSYSAALSSHPTEFTQVYRVASLELSDVGYSSSLISCDNSPENSLSVQRLVPNKKWRGSKRIILFIYSYTQTSIIN